MNETLIRWYPNVDTKGTPVAPGDTVSLPRRSHSGRRTPPVKGRLGICPRSLTVLSDGTTVPSLVVVTEDGTTYNATSKIRKIK
jgi:hypothetical protein